MQFHATAKEVERKCRLRERKLELGLVNGAAQKAAIRTKRNSSSTRRPGVMVARHLPSYLHKGEPRTSAADVVEPAAAVLPEGQAVVHDTEAHASHATSDDRELNLRTLLRRGLSASLSYFNQVADDLRTSMRASITAGGHTPGTTGIALENQLVRHTLDVPAALGSMPPGGSYDC